MRLEMSGFVQNDHFDLKSYLTYLFNKLDEPKQENKKHEILVTTRRKKQSDGK
jgi:hypothetical protein